MEHLVECVPNFSSVDRELLDSIERAIASTRGAWLLDRSSDSDHARSVFTFAGTIDATRSAMEAAVAVAIERIDLRHHAGQHPRLGAVDVVPFVPLGTTSMAQCVDLAQSFATTVAARYSLPIYLYGEAATRPERRILANVRKPRFEGLADAMRRPDGEPDFGPSAPHPSAGAMAVGARPFLIAFNIQLSTPDVAIAKRIATRVRERDGGLVGVQALGLELPSRGTTQVSMNVLDHSTAPLWRVWDAVAQQADLEGVSVDDSELIGLVPSVALTDVADHIGAAPDRPLEERLLAGANWLRIRDFDPDMALELRLARARSAEH
ncbi:MAG: glutamate formimidoyltransferase [Chloroflexota bacterium]